MKKHLFPLLLGLLCLFGCGDASSPTLPNSYTTLTSIEITLPYTQIANMTSSQMTATGNFSGLFTRDITADVIWESLNLPVATVSNAQESSGRVSALAPGNSEIRATLNGIVGSYSLTVSNATVGTLTLSPLTPTIPKGLIRQFTVEGTFDDATTQDLSYDVTWSSSDITVASISNSVGSKGVATGEGVGIATITATFDGFTDSTVMTVSAAILNMLELEPLTPSLLTLFSRQMTATATYSDASVLDVTTLVDWVSSKETIALISTLGVVSALAEGGTSITASLDGQSASTLLSVTGGSLSAIAVLPGNSTQVHIAPVLPFQMTADGLFTNGSRDISAHVTWESSEPTVATIDADGVITTVAAGDTIITATYGSISGNTNLTVIAATYTAGSLMLTPATTDLTVLALGTSRSFLAQGDFSDGSTRDLTSAVTWSSSDPTVSTVNTAPLSKGVVAGVTAGNATITADFRSLDTDSTNITVTAPTLLSLSIEGLTTTIRPSERRQFIATATYDSTPMILDVTEDVSWSSSDISTAIFHDAVNARGEVIGVDTGSVILTATFGGEEATVTLLVE